jgi:hypothetical protein
MPQSSTLETLLFGELRKLSSLIRKVNVVGVFINITFEKLPSRNREILLNGVADRLFRVLSCEYSFFRESENMWVFKKVV